MMSNQAAKEIQAKKNMPKKWQGLKPARFAKYRSWINSGTPGICGTYCSAVLVHDAVLQKYKKSFFWDVQHGLKALLKDIPDWSVKSGLITEKIVPALLDRPNPVPVIVGTTRIFNSKYKNHWVVVYAYGYNEDGKLFYKAYDNHGRYQAILPASQTIGCVWLEERKNN